MVTVRLKDLDGNMRQAEISREDIIAYLKVGASTNPEDSFKNSVIGGVVSIMPYGFFAGFNYEYQANEILEILESSNPPENPGMKHYGEIYGNK
jgi:hypothetical protein